MSISNIPEEAPKLGIGSVISRSLSIVFSHFFTFLGLILLTFSPLIGVAFLMMFASDETMAAIHLLVLVLGGIVFMAAVQGGITLMTFRILRSEPVNVISTVRVVLPRILPFFGTCLLFAFVVGLPTFIGVFFAVIFNAPAFLFLMVGSVYLLCRLYTTIPACLIEKLGPVESLQRAASLSVGYRGAIFVLLIITVVISVLVELFFGLIATVGEDIPILGAVISVAVLLVTLVFGQSFSSSVTAIVYFDLRNVKEGVGVDSLVNVFD